MNENPRTKITLLTDIISNGKDKTVYGKKSETVKLISTHGETLIVEGKMKFAVNKEEVRIVNL